MYACSDLATDITIYIDYNNNYKALGIKDFVSNMMVIFAF